MNNHLQGPMEKPLAIHQFYKHIVVYRPVKNLTSVKLVEKHLIN